jgi:hypothetical protein
MNTKELVLGFCALAAVTGTPQVFLGAQERPVDAAENLDDTKKRLKD